MKTAILTAAMMILVSITATAGNYEKGVNPGNPGANGFKVTIAQPANQTIYIRVANPETDKVVMKIYNEKNVKVFHRVVKKEKLYNVKCDMSNCCSGVYTCVVKRNGKEESRKQVLILN